MFYRKLSKSISDIVAEWDALAPIRVEQISSGCDVTFNHILAPHIIKMSQEENFRTAIDAGCGVGILTDMISKKGIEIVGIDPSSISISIAIEKFGNNCTFLNSTLEEYSINIHKKVDLVVANMVLMDVLNIDTFLQSVKTILNPNGSLLFSITHPFFWPEYYGYSQEEWFSYKNEIIIESKFKISNDQSSELRSTHIHRPLERYVKAFSKSGFFLENLYEPMPNTEIQKLYPTPWRSPRYIIGKCRAAL